MFFLTRASVKVLQWRFWVWSSSDYRAGVTIQGLGQGFHVEASQK